jgi:hypothetical protein
MELHRRIRLLFSCQRRDYQLDVCARARSESASAPGSRTVFYLKTTARASRRRRCCVVKFRCFDGRSVLTGRFVLGTRIQNAPSRIATTNANTANTASTSSLKAKSTSDTPSLWTPTKKFSKDLGEAEIIKFLQCKNQTEYISRVLMVDCQHLDRSR